jgi:Histidine kinase-, DNA gyrase B-, and HSP90-like ATPase
MAVFDPPFGGSAAFLAWRTGYNARVDRFDAMRLLKALVAAGAKPSAPMDRAWVDQSCEHLGGNGSLAGSRSNATDRHGAQQRRCSFVRDYAETTSDWFWEVGPDYKYGSPMYVKASGKPVFGADGEFRGYRGTGTDVAGAGPRDLSISTEPQANGVLVAVRDTGPGIDGEHLERVFQPFYTTKSGGVGMGLSICRSIIEAHGGRLWADANESRGALFQFTLPIAESLIINSPGH